MTCNLAVGSPKRFQDLSSEFHPLVTQITPNNFRSHPRLDSVQVFCRRQDKLAKTALGSLAIRKSRNSSDKLPLASSIFHW